MLVSTSIHRTSLALFAALSITSAVMAQHGNMEAMKMNAMGSPALDGYCAVCLVEKQAWNKGNTNFASNYDGHQYLFPGAKQKAMFDANPNKYAPVLGGDDIVAFAKTGSRTPGKVSEAISHNGRYYFFASAENKQAFKRSPKEYMNADLALDGDCVVCRVDKNHKMAGKPTFTTLHDGLRYQFPNAAIQKAFTANPTKYAQAANN